jgi:tRNA-dependent cyclodipeptide synthase
MPLNQPLRKNSNVLWTISLIQDQNPEAQTKSEFSDMTNDVLMTGTVRRVTLCLADNLQRFRFMIRDGMSESEAINACQKMSTQWHQDNALSVEKLKESKNLSFITWEEFLSWPEYASTLEKLEGWYKENRDFRNAVDGRVKQVREGLGNDVKISNPVQQTELLKKYLFEECAFQKFAASKGFDYEIYKTPPCQAMRRVKNNTDYVPSGFMCDVNFTQFNPSTKKLKIIETPISSEKESFSTVFSKKPSTYPGGIDLSIPIKFAEFIEKTLQMVPPQEQEKAVEALMRFTTQEILPMCYSKNPTLKI